MPGSPPTGDGAAPQGGIGARGTARDTAPMILTDVDELAAWLRLLATPGIGRGAARQLLASFGTPHGVFEASSGQRRACVDALAADALDAEPPRFPSLLAST